MKRGQPLSHQDRKPIVISDDIEGGGNNIHPPPNYSKTNKSKTTSSHDSGSTGGGNRGGLAPPPPSVGYLTGGGGGGSRSMSAHDRMAYAYLTRTTHETLKKVAVALLVGVMLGSMFLSGGSIVVKVMIWVYGAVAFG